MTDTSVKKISSGYSPSGEMGQVYLASGVEVAMRLWRELTPGPWKEQRARDYETVGYVVAGCAELDVEDQLLRLQPGDSWVVPRNARHAYRIVETFTAVEATAPPAHAHHRDEPAG